MKIETFILCDAATEFAGKLNILGTFDSIHARQVPAVHPQCAVAMRLRFDRQERGEHKVRVNMIDADGRLVIPSLDAMLQVRTPEAASSCAINMILNLQSLKFERFGEYSIDLQVDGVQVASLPLFVWQMQAQPPGPTQPRL
jgi:hypothetical protein